MLTRTAPSSTAAAAAGSVVFRELEGDLYHLAAKPGAERESLTQKLDQLSPAGGDERVNVSPNGRWLLIESQRFGCEGWPCLSVVNKKVTGGQAMRSGGDFVEGSTNAVGPCGLPGKRIASLALARPGNDQGLHELVFTNAAGGKRVYPLKGIDVLDAGIGCSKK